MRNNKAVKATIKKLGINGEGIAYLDKKITFVHGALPDEEVLIDVIRDEPKYKIGQLKSVLHASPNRVQAKCRAQKECLGCPLMIYDYRAQLESKYQLVKDTFHKYVGEAFEETEFEEVLPSSQQAGIRNIVRLPVVMFNDRITFGIYQRESKYLTLMTGCMMQSKRINSCLEKLETIMNDMHLHAYDELKKKGVRFLTVREFDNGLQLIFITGTDRLPDRAIEAISKIKDVASIYISVNTTRKQDFELARYELKYGKNQMEQIFMQKQFIVSSKADFPVYRQHALRVAKNIASLIEDDVKKIIDVGCGIGLYSLGLDEKYEIRGIDTSKINIMDALNSMHLQNRSHASYEDGKIDNLFTILSKRYHFDLALLHLDAFKMNDVLIDSIIASKTKYLILDSDHASMMAKNIAELTRTYQLKKIVALDGNPHGAGVSVIAFMTRKR